jgi:hypothetical protein
LRDATDVRESLRAHDRRASEASGHQSKEQSMNTKQLDNSVSTRTSARRGIKRRISIGIIAVAAFASLALPSAGLAAGSERLTAGDGSVKLPPGWCYSDAIGTYECKFKIAFPFPPGW